LAISCHNFELVGRQCIELQGKQVTKLGPGTVVANCSGPVGKARKSLENQTLVGELEG